MEIHSNSPKLYYGFKRHTSCVLYTYVYGMYGTLLSVYFQTKLFLILFSETIDFRKFVGGSHITNVTKWGIILKIR